MDHTESTADRIERIGRQFEAGELTRDEAIRQIETETNTRGLAAERRLDQWWNYRANVEAIFTAHNAWMWAEIRKRRGELPADHDGREWYVDRSTTPWTAPNTTEKPPR